LARVHGGYLMHNSCRIALDGLMQGMYFFGYGDFYSAKGTLGVGLTHNWRLTGGYQMGTRLNIHGGSNQIDVRLTQKGPVAGIEGSSWNSMRRLPQLGGQRAMIQKVRSAVTCDS
jgi:hypothetical protein